MTFELMRRDPAWKMALGLSAVVAVALPCLPPTGNALTLFPAAAAILACLARAQAHRRATLFEAALPIAARQIFTARVLSLLAIVWLPVAAGAIALALLRPGQAVLLNAMLEWAALISVPIVFLQAFRIRELAAPPWLAFAVTIVAMPLAALAASLASAEILVAACGGICLAIVAVGCALVPPGFQAAPMAASRSRAHARPPRLRLAAWWPMVRSALGPYTLIYMPVMLMQAASGQWFYAECFSLAMLSQTQSATRWLFGLPVSHRTRFLIATLPAVLPILIGVILHASFSVHSEEVTIGGALFRGGSDEPYRPGTPNVQVPLEFWRYAAGGVAPEIRAPWGESVHPSTIRVLAGSYYNPYQVERANSKEFMEWQFVRATTAIYGQPIERARYRSALQAGLRTVLSSARLQVLNVAAVLLIALVFVAYTAFYSWHRLARLSRTARNLILIVLFGVPFVILFGYDLLSLSSVPTMMSTHVLPLFLLALSGRLPQSLPATVAIAALPVIAAYLGVERLASRSDIQKPVKTVAQTWGN